VKGNVYLDLDKNETDKTLSVAAYSDLIAAEQASGNQNIL
jgi:hypothetical protein